MIYINKMDITGADFYNVMKMMDERLKCNAVPIQLPIGKRNFPGCHRSHRHGFRRFYDDLGKDMRGSPSPRTWRIFAAEYRDKLRQISDLLTMRSRRCI